MLVLVGYASAHGSTRQIAERVGSRIGRSGATVRVVPVGDLHDLESYDAVVLGSAIHHGAWLPEATDAVRANADVLAAKPVWLFSVGMVEALPHRLQGRAMQQGPKAVAAIEQQIHPRAHRLFSGAIRRDQMSRRGSLLLRLMGCRYGDYRAWPEIDAWAGDLADQMALDLARPATSGST
jgi:menaquinone-dependent protoporphyrinogen oxidase